MLKTATSIRIFLNDQFPIAQFINDLFSTNVMCFLQGWWWKSNMSRLKSKSALIWVSQINSPVKIWHDCSQGNFLLTALFKKKTETLFTLFKRHLEEQCMIDISTLTLPRIYNCYYINSLWLLLIKFWWSNLSKLIHSFVSQIHLICLYT